ncbi:N-acetylmuramoyl-L-alanine amidase [Aureibacter tunicatorum]|uniref:N-acetylmuramoyl-L-alanine amidase n=1 Tax=Aureibacter tunicatorum TaxID=866807 RepID=A0AAE3XLA4_9BACT|nr:N-acetylmuramoyl-L-alanine amidase [Aureibacter tunicatorum]MDR6238595.1 N-acetylmuramoyl-L-alanine amidase [Aureibacter tunicatorum]BDD05474.1 hypothetical protein AUTU_29570 [Aureibacter tunicatorum]
MLTIENHKFEEQVSDITHMSCPKNTKKLNGGKPDCIVIHYTASPSAKQAAEYLRRNDVKASAHIVLGRKGHVYQLVPFDTVSWHAGASSLNGRSGFNDFSIGIEIDNAGVLNKVGEKYQAWFGKSIPENEVIKATHRNESNPRYWHAYTEAQIDKIFEICEALIKAYPSIKSIHGHEEISPGRKSDPGPAFPLDRLRDRFFSNRKSNTESLEINEHTGGRVNVSKLNVRSLPSYSASTVSAPLSFGTELKILDEHNGWLKVETRSEGWVAGEFVSLDKS